MMDAFPKLPFTTAMALLQTKGAFDRDTLDTVYTLLSAKQVDIDALEGLENARGSQPVSTEVLKKPNLVLLALTSDLLLGRIHSEYAAPKIEALRKNIETDDPATLHAIKVLEFAQKNEIL